jgi:hypothetical protein
MPARNLETSARNIVGYLLRTMIYMAPGLVLLAALSRHREEPSSTSNKLRVSDTTKHQPVLLNPAAGVRFVAWDYYDP